MTLLGSFLFLIQSKGVHGAQSNDPSPFCFDPLREGPGLVMFQSSDEEVSSTMILEMSRQVGGWFQVVGKSVHVLGSSVVYRFGCLANIFLRAFFASYQVNTVSEC